MRVVLVDGAQHIKNPVVVGKVAADRPDIDHGIKTVEPAFSRLRVVLPPAADVLRIDQFVTLVELLGLSRQTIDLLVGEHTPQYQKTVVLVLANVLGVQTGAVFGGSGHGRASRTWSDNQTTVR